MLWRTTSDTCDRNSCSSTSIGGTFFSRSLIVFSCCLLLQAANAPGAFARGLLAFEGFILAALCVRLLAADSLPAFFGAACAAGGRWRAAGEGLAFGRDFYRPAGAGAFSLLFIWAACAAGGGRWRRGLVLWDEIFIGLRARGFFAALYLGRLRGGRQMGAC